MDYLSKHQDHIKSTIDKKTKSASMTIKREAWDTIMRDLDEQSRKNMMDELAKNGGKGGKNFRVTRNGDIEFGAINAITDEEY